MRGTQEVGGSIPPSSTILFFNHFSKVLIKTLIFLKKIRGNTHNTGYIYIDEKKFEMKTKEKVFTGIFLGLGFFMMVSGWTLDTLFTQYSSFLTRLLFFIAVPVLIIGFLINRIKK